MKYLGITAYDMECVAGGINLRRVPTTGSVVNPNTVVGISQYKDKRRDCCANVRTVY